MLRNITFCRLASGEVYRKPYSREEDHALCLAHRILWNFGRSQRRNGPENNHQLPKGASVILPFLNHYFKTSESCGTFAPSFHMDIPTVSVPPVGVKDEQVRVMRKMKEAADNRRTSFLQVLSRTLQEVHHLRPFVFICRERRPMPFCVMDAEARMAGQVSEVTHYSFRRVDGGTPPCGRDRRPSTNG